MHISKLLAKGAHTQTYTDNAEGHLHRPFLHLQLIVKQSV